MSRRFYLLPGDVTLLLTNLAGFYGSAIAQNSSVFSSLLANWPRRYRASTLQDIYLQQLRLHVTNDLLLKNRLLFSGASVSMG